MSGLLLVVALANGSTYRPPDALATLRALGTARSHFEQVLRLNNHYEVERMYCMAMGADGQGCAYYPIGRADCRFLCVTWAGGGRLEYQVRKGHTSISKWQLEVTDGRRATHYKGTMAAIVTGLGHFRKAPSKSQLHDLALVSPLASYGPDPVGRLWTTVYTASGKAVATAVYDSLPTLKERTSLPVMEEESKMLGLGPIGWTPLEVGQRRSRDR